MILLDRPMSSKDLQRVTECVSDIGQAPSRRSLPARRQHITQKVRITGQHTLYLSVHDDAQPAEVFLRVKGPDCSAEEISLYDVVARLMSLALQYGASRSRKSVISLQALNLSRAAQYPGTIVSSIVRVCRISSVCTCWRSTADGMISPMFLAQRKRTAHHAFERVKLTIPRYQFRLLLMSVAMRCYYCAELAMIHLCAR
jgi:hypothetical protein